LSFYLGGSRFEIIPGTISNSVEALDLSESKGEVTIHSPFSGVEQFRGTFTFRNSSMRFKEIEKRVEQLEGTLTFTPERTIVENVSGNWGGGDFQLSGNVGHDRGIRTGPLDFEFSGSELTFQQFLPRKLRGKIEGKLSLDGSIGGSVQAPEIQSTITTDKINYRNWEARDGQFDVLSTRDRVRVSDVQASIRGSKLSGNARLIYPNQFSVSASMNGARIPYFLREIDYLHEQTVGDVNLDLNLKGRTDDHQSWTGKVLLAHNGVQLNQFPDVPGLETIAKSSVLSSTIPIRNDRQSFPIRDGKLRVNGFKLRSRGLELNGKGFVSSIGKMDLKFVLRFKDETLRVHLQDLLGNLYRELGLSDLPEKFDIPFYVEGTVYQPEVRLDNEHISNKFRSNLIRSIIPEKLGGGIIDEIIGEFFE